MKILLFYSLLLSLLFYNPMEMEANCNIENKDSLTVEQMHIDIDFYFSTLKDIHPYLYEKYSETQFDSVYTHLKQVCNKKMPTDDFIFQLMKTKKIVDEHTGFSALPSKAPKKRVQWVDFFDNKASVGDLEIKSINQTPIANIIIDLDKMVSWARLPIIRKAQMSRLLTYYLNYQYGNPPYNCLVRNSKIGVEFHWNLNVDTTNYEVPSSYDKRFHKGVTSQRIFENDSIAVFYYNTSRNEKESEVESSANSFFEGLNKNIRYLFIDVSQNGGGSDNTHGHILKYLKTSPFEVLSTSYLTVRTEYESANHKIESIARSNGVPKIEGEIFDGKVFVIMGPSTFSAGYGFCEFTKRMQAGYLVGETTGQKCNYAGNTQEYKLPESGIHFNCPTKFDIITPSIANSEGFLDPDINYPLDHPLELEDYKKIIEKSILHNL